MFVTNHTRATTNIPTYIGGFVLGRFGMTMKLPGYETKQMSTDNRSRHNKRSVQPTPSFEALADSRRQFVLWYLSQRSDTVLIDELAEQLARWCEKPQAHIRLSLYHVQLPKLADAGLIRYDTEQETVKSTAMAERIVTILDQVSSIER